MLSCNITLDAELAAKTVISSRLYQIDILPDINVFGDYMLLLELKVDSSVDSQQNCFKCRS